MPTEFPVELTPSTTPFKVDGTGKVYVSGSIAVTGSYSGFFNANISQFPSGGLNANLGYAALYGFDGYGGPVPNGPDNSWYVNVVQAGFAGRGLQIAGGYDTGDIYFRKGNTTWQSWNRILNATVDTYAAATQHVDQGLSLTLFFKDTATTRDVNKAQIYAWTSGIKTIYYIRIRQAALEGTEVESCISCTL